MTATERPLKRHYSDRDYSEMTLQTAAGNRPCVICSHPIQKGSRYLYAVVRIDKTVTRRHVCRTCCLIRPQSELNRAWNTLLSREEN